jgi:hypothetical protein
MRLGCFGNDCSWGSLDPSPRSPPAGQHRCGPRLIRTQTNICGCCRTRAQARACIQLPRAEKGLGRRPRQARRSARGLDTASFVQAHSRSPHERSSSRQKTCATLLLATACLSSSHSLCRAPARDNSGTRLRTPYKKARRRDVDIRNYLRDQAGSRSLVFDLSITHHRYGSSSHPLQNGRLTHPQDMDAPLHIAAQRKMNSFRQQYADNRDISFLPAIVSTSTRMPGEFLHLLFLQVHRETEAHFTATGMP